MVGGREGHIGAVIGSALGNVIVTSRVFFNADQYGSSIGYSGSNVQNGSQGLRGPQIADAKYYADGTIDLVLADRAAKAEQARLAEEERRAKLAEQERLAKAAEDTRIAEESARQQVRQQSSSRVASSEVAQALKPTVQVPSLSSEGFHAQTAALERSIVFADLGFSVGVKSVEVDGKVYQLNEEGGVKKK